MFDFSLLAGQLSQESAPNTPRDCVLLELDTFHNQYHA
jgi:hypothetical protein